MASMKITANVLAAFSVALPVTPATAEDNAITCPKAAGYIAGPFVPDADTARAIFLIVEARQHPGVDKTRFSEVIVQEGPTEWIVFRAASLPAPQSDGVIAVPAFGAHTLVIAIDKCSGAISKAYYQR